MPRYEYTDDTSNKFWEIERDGSSVTTRWGRIGTGGQEKTKDFGTDAKATKEYDKLVKEKTGKGYAMVGGKKKKKEEPASSKSNPDLVKTIRKNVDDPKAYLVYADWLQTAGDARGELITVQERLLSDPKDKAMRKAEQKLLEGHVAEFFGAEHPESNSNVPKRDQLPEWRAHRMGRNIEDELWAFGHFRTEWFCGFVRSLWFEPGYYADERPGDECAAILRDFLAHPSSTFIRDLYVGDIWIGDDFDGLDMSPAVEAIAGSPVAAHLEGVTFIGGDHDISGVSLDARPILKACKSLRRLTLHAGQLTIGKLAHPTLEKLAVQSGSLDTDSIKSICSAKLPELVDLEIWFGSENYGASGGIEDIRSLLQGKGFEKVKRLGLMNSEFADEICHALPKAPILKQLEHLDLSMGIMTAEGAQALLDHKKAFAHLKSIDLSQNFIAEELHQDLKKLGPKVELGKQEQSLDYRYVSVGE